MADPGWYTSYPFSSLALSLNLKMLYFHSIKHFDLPPCCYSSYHCPSGSPPRVIARGGFSGLFPESTIPSYQFALENGLPDVVMHCDLQLSSDSKGFCRSGLRLDKSTHVADVFPKRNKTYKLGNEDVHGWFAVDFTSDELLNNVTGMHPKSFITGK